MRVAVIDSGGANIGSVRYALDRLGADSVLTGEAAVIRACERVILPGVGEAREAMARLRARASAKDVVAYLAQQLEEVVR